VVSSLLQNRPITRGPPLYSTVISHLNAARTKVIVIDELQNFNMSGPQGEVGARVLKSLMNQVPAVFVYTGYGLQGGTLLNGEIGRQIRDRSTTRVIRPFTYATPEDKQIWADVVGGFESAARLYNHQPGDLADHYAALFDRTQGVIGMLDRLILGAAELLTSRGVEPVEEKITMDLLAKVPLPDELDGPE
jgi:hypothetical protein